MGFERMIYLNVVLGICALIYMVFIVFFFCGLRKVRLNKDLSAEYPQIAIVVAARNEENNIRRTVKSLAAQNYPADRYDIIVVNDRSSDTTGVILQDLQKTITNLKIITITECPPDVSPKKHALIQAVKTTRHRFILTTDADCVHDPNWASSYVGLIEDGLGVATGITVFRLDEYRSGFERFWQNLQNIEYMSHQIVLAGAIGHNVGFSANGNNMLFNRQLYDDYEHEALQKKVISGDDFFIIQTAEKKHYRLKFNLHPAGMVQTPPQRTLRDLINQRARWSSKIGKASAPVLLFSVSTFFYYLGLSAYPFLLIFFPGFWLAFVVLFGIKFFCDTLYIVYGYKKFGQKLNPLYYIFMGLIHAPFIVIVAVIGSLFGFTWKGGRYKIDSKKM
ncbi:glycosyltransferase [bacterium]|nr:glycosyltransferase [bacterium]MBU1065575.1 glycosyltransferase [bacterium]MBU1872510.1 glycosyltransferase [bacterium]